MSDHNSVPVNDHNSTVYVALLRAVNVGGTGKLAMADLRALCTGLGFEGVQTYIQSGNVVFAAGGPREAVAGALAAALESHMGRAVGIQLRTAAQMGAVLECNPFPEALPSQLLVFFLDAAPAQDELAKIVTPAGEQVAAVGSEVYVHFPQGQGGSKLKLGFVAHGTGRNLNTVRTVHRMATELAAAREGRAT